MIRFALLFCLFDFTSFSQCCNNYAELSSNLNIVPWVILPGQSNEMGSSEDNSVLRITYSNVHFISSWYDGPYKPGVTSNGESSGAPFVTPTEPDSLIGFDVTLIPKLLEIYPELYVTKAPINGAALCSQEQPNGVAWVNLVYQINKTKEIALANGDKLDLILVPRYQGETDALCLFPPCATNYYSNITDYFNRFDLVVQDNDYKIILAAPKQTSNVNFCNIGSVRESIFAYANLHENVFVIDADTFQHEADDLHLSNKGLKDFGNLIFEVYNGN